MIRALLIGSLLAIGGCKESCDASMSCPTPASVRGECMAERTCAVDGAMGWCETGDCMLARGTTLTVPVDTLDLAKIPALFVDYRTHATGAPAPTAIDAELDGVKGKAVAIASGGKSPAAIVTWDPFPSDPKTLTIRFDDGNKKSVDPDFQFEDEKCEGQDQVDCAAF